MMKRAILPVLQITLLVAVIVAGGLGVLKVANVLDGDTFFELLGQSLGIIAVLGLCAGAAMAVLSPK